MSNRIMAGNKMVLLFMLYQMDMSISWSTLHDFAVPDYMDYFDFSTYLAELEENSLIEAHSENNTKYYTITESGEQSLHYFSRLIPESKKKSILFYINKNKKRIKREYSVYANYFYHKDDEYVVKCGILEDDSTLLELNITVVNKEQAKLVRKNWKENCNNIYGSLLKELLTTKKSDTEESSDKKNEIKRSNLG